MLCHARFGVGRSDFHAIGILDRALPQQVPAHHKNIRQGAGDKQPMGILGDSAIAHFDKAKHSFNDPDWVLASGSDPGFIAVSGAFGSRERLVSARLLLREVARLWSNGSDRLGLPAIGRVPPHPGLIAMQELRQRWAVVHVRRSGRYRMDELQLTVDPKVRLHPEVPLATLLGLAHLRIALTGSILGRTRGVDDCGIDNRAAAHFEPLRRKMGSDRFKVVSSGTGSRPRSMSAKARIAAES